MLIDKQRENSMKAAFKESCKTGKQKFRSKEHAIAFDDFQNGGLLYPYICPHCGAWHLTRTRQ